MKNNTYIIYKTICNIFLNIKDGSFVIGLILKRIHSLIKNNGTLYTVTYLKQARLHVTRFYCGSPLKVNDKNVSLDKSGYPIIFKETKKYINGSLFERKFLFTLINISRTIKPKKNEIIPINLNPITDSFSGSNPILDKRILKQVIKDLNIGLKIKNLELNDLKLTTKAGPHGPQTLSSLYTLKRYTKTLVSATCGLLSSEVYSYFKDCYTHVLRNDDEFKPCGSRHTSDLRRLSIVKDPECKMRVIAMFDWFSQITLKALSDSLFQALKCIDSDRTYTQDPKFHFVPDLKHKLWSIDLTSATDRFPIITQKQILGILTNTCLADDWADIMVSEPCSFQGQSLYYKVGQPMGAHSSWPMFTLSHHILVRYCGILNGLTNFNKYIMLGDDIVINNDKVAKTYIRLLRVLGVETSKAKTHVSKHTYEFAKRWIDLRLAEVTGLPVKGIIDNNKNISICFQILFDYINKGNSVNHQNALTFDVAKFLYKIQDFTKPCYGFRKILKIIIPISFFMRLRFGMLTNEELRNQISLWTSKNQFIIGGSEKLFRDEIKRLFNLVYINILGKSSQMTAEFYHKILEFVELEDNFLEDSSHPILLVINNYLEEMVEKSDPSKQMSMTLKDMCDALPLLDIESIMSHQRNKILLMNNNTKMAHKFVSMVKSLDYDKPVEVNYNALQGMGNMRSTLQRFQRNYL
ncbi:RNA-dependent RNA polymerase [Gremmeniella abietina non-host-specific mitochondrial RNA virus S1]|uniref:RNA-dependent RNA polymerase n=1 Tax=Gremmeniella abietina mitovirus 2 TaxID=3070915 RepID=A0ACA7IU70_9VIRU|nr:RNA-dependent RNA polymerase [Gremmeniella abietina non-host-specific mitochondrial RNA virus S1]AEY76153.1 RNA-dependent RNA polymerase [Gremmeniella abietina mitovirus 2]